MTQKSLQVSRIVVRILSSVTLGVLSLSLILDRYFASASRSLANSRVGTLAIIWTAVTAFLLPAYVGVEVWWAGRLGIERSGLWIDALLAFACLVFFAAVSLYSLTHYAMLSWHVRERK
jgi:hypothetical protein